MKSLVVGISSESSVILLEGQLKYFKEIGYDTYLLSPTSERVKIYCKKEGCTHLPVEIRREISMFHDFNTLLRIFTIFIRHKPDIINLGTPKVSLLGMIAGKLLGIPIRIYTCRGFRFEPENGFKRKILVLMEKITASCAQKVICISPSLRDYGIENRIFTLSKAVVINRGSSNGINLKRFSMLNINNELRNKLQNEHGIKNKFVFGFIGRIYDRKGINELYHAFSALCDSCPDIVLLMVGRIEVSQIIDKEIIDLLRSHNRIILAGPQQDVPLYLSLMDVFVVPAWGEGFGNVMIEAAAMGLPVISTDATGIKDSVMNNFNGLVVKPKSIDRLIDAMKLLYENKDLRITLGQNGLIWAKNFDNLIIWKGMEEIYKSA
jgi:glycosyltransferase involved in cell wall biosynthesis